MRPYLYLRRWWRRTTSANRAMTSVALCVVVAVVAWIFAPTGGNDVTSVKGVATAKFTLTARGGPVRYSVTPGGALAGSMTVTPSAGTLAAGASVTITVTSTSLVALDGQLTVNPGGRTIAVVLSISL